MLVHHANDSCACRRSSRRWRGSTWLTSRRKRHRRALLPPPHAWAASLHSPAACTAHAALHLLHAHPLPSPLPAPCVPSVHPLGPKHPDPKHPVPSIQPALPDHSPPLTHTPSRTLTRSLSHSHHTPHTARPPGQEAQGHQRQRRRGGGGGGAQSAQAQARPAADEQARP